MPTSKVETRFRFVQNTSGTRLDLPDLGRHGTVLERDERVDLLERFTPAQINRSDALQRAVNVLFNIDTTGKKVPWLTTFVNKQEMIRSKFKSEEPIQSIDGEGRKTLRHDVVPGQVMRADPHIFDDKLDEQEEKERKQEDKARAKAAGARRGPRQQVTERRRQERSEPTE